jgi:putative DNA primase/helicase
VSNIRVLPPRPRDESWRNLLQKGDKGAYRCNVTNAILVLTYHPAWAGLLAWDAFAERVVFTREPPWEREVSTARRPHWTENDMCRLVDWFARNVEMQMKAPALEPALVTIAAERETHPPRAYLAALRWDHVQRLPTWLSTYCGAQATPYSEAAGLRWLVQAVARIMVPGCQADSMLILESPEQGTGKSSAFRALMPNVEWYSDTGISIGDKDSYQALHGVWLVVLDELDSMRRGERTKYKSFLTARKDHFRPPYARLPRDFLRQNVFAGTTNETEYFQDRTGNRRFWPVAVKNRIDVAAIERDRDQLWAEARTRYESGERWYADTAEVTSLFAEEQGSRVQADDWEPIVAAWLARPRVVTGPPGNRVESEYDASRGVLTKDVLLYAIGKPAERIATNTDTQRAAEVLRTLRYEKGPLRRENGHGVRRFLPCAEK